MEVVFLFQILIEFLELGIFQVFCASAGTAPQEQAVLGFLRRAGAVEGGVFGFDAVDLAIFGEFFQLAVDGGEADLAAVLAEFFCQFQGGDWGISMAFQP